MKRRRASATLSSTFRAELADVYAQMRALALSPPFLSDLPRIYGTLPTATDANLLRLADRFCKWRRATKEFVRHHVNELSDDDPLRCPISLFRTMDAGRLETAHTRTLAWLFDPKAEHGFGATLLATVMKRLPGCNRKFEIQQVKCEYSIDQSGNKGRLDVLVEGRWKDTQRNEWLLIIEAKVDAAERDDQLQKYDKWLSSYASSREKYRVFLTAKGHEPETGEEDWEPLSFLELVRAFRAVYCQLRSAPGFHFLRFYLAGVLQDICNLPRNVCEDAADPYAVASYLKTVRESIKKGERDDSAG